MAYDQKKDPYNETSEQARAELPARRAAAVVPSNTVDLETYAKGLYVGVAGDVKVIPVGNADDAPVTFKAHPVGYLQCQVRRVFDTGTTATNLLAMFG